MGTKGRQLFLSLTVFTGLLFGQAKIIHNPPRNVMANSPIKIEAMIENQQSEVERVRIFFREAGQETYVEEDMYESMEVYQGEIPAEFVRENGVEYLIIAEFADGSMTAFPEVDPYNVPIFLPVKRGAEQRATRVVSQKSDVQGGIPSNVIILSPGEGETIAAEEVVIAFSLFNSSDVALESVDLKLDGISILKNTEISEDVIIARPRNLKPGLHTAKLNMQNEFGDPFSTVMVNFSVVRTLEEAQRIFKYTGRVTTESSSEQVRGIRQNIHWLRGNFNGTYDWLKFNAKTFISSQEDPNKQPRNRYMAGVKTSYLDLYLGDVNPQFSEFALRGKRVRGIEGDLKLKYFNTHVVYGQVERAIQGTISEKPDTVTEGGVTRYRYNRSGYTYARNLLAVRPYFGSGRHFQLGFSFLKALDDTISVKREYGGIQQTDDILVAMRGAQTPKDNIVLGTDLILAFDSKRFVWQNDLAISLLNRDISEGPLTKEGLDTFVPGDTLVNDTLDLGDEGIPLSAIPFDPADISRLFIINKNMSPLMPIVPDSTGAIGMAQVLNMPSTAFRTALKLNYFNNFFIFRYQRVGPEFNSLGNPYLRKDIQGFNVSDKIRLFSNRMFVTLAYDQKRNNLMGNKEAETTTSSLNAGLSLYPGEGLPTINFNTMHYTRQNDLGIANVDTSYEYDPIVTDSLISITFKDPRESNLTIRQDLRISHIVQVGDIKNTLNITYANSERSDRVSNRPEGYSFNATSTSMFSLGVNSTFGFPLRTNLRVTSNTTESALVDDPYRLLSLYLKGRYDLFDGNLSAELGYNLTKGSGMVDFSKNNIFVSGYYRLFDQHQFRWWLQFSHLADRLSGDNYSDLSFRLNYSFLF